MGKETAAVQRLEMLVGAAKRKVEEEKGAAESDMMTGFALIQSALFFCSYFDGANASGKPIVAVIGTLLLLGYSLEYQHLKYHKNNAH